MRGGRDDLFIQRNCAERLYGTASIRFVRRAKNLKHQKRHRRKAEALGRNEPPVAYLQKLGLVETETDNDELSRYRIASRCIFCPADTTESVVLRAMDKEILQWLKNAGVRLTVAELVYLIENGIKPTQDLLYTDNRQRLIERIYTVNTIADNLLENQMETAKCRDAVVQSLTRLLKKKLVLVL
mgnify:CR=1 FL=1